MFFEIEIIIFIVEAIIKGEMQHAKKHGDWKKDMAELQLDTIKAIQEKAAKGHLHQYDVGRRDTYEERIIVDINVHDIQKEKTNNDVGQQATNKEEIDVDITVQAQVKEKTSK